MRDAKRPQMAGEPQSSRLDPRLPPVGNVRNWCADWYDKDHYDGSPTDDPSVLSTGSDRVNRGGSWNNNAVDCRSASRDWSTPGNRHDYLGFRLALVPSS